MIGIVGYLHNFHVGGLLYELERNFGEAENEEIYFLGVILDLRFRDEPFRRNLLRFKKDVHGIRKSDAKQRSMKYSLLIRGQKSKVFKELSFEVYRNFRY